MRRIQAAHRLSCFERVWKHGQSFNERVYENPREDGGK